MRYLWPEVGGVDTAGKTRRYEVSVVDGPSGSMVLKAFTEATAVKETSAQGFMEELWHVADRSGIIYGTAALQRNGRARAQTITAVEGRASAYAFDWHRRRWTESRGSYSATPHGGSVAVWPHGQAVLIPTRDRGVRSLSAGEIDGLILINYAAGAYSSLGYAPPCGPAPLEHLLRPLVGVRRPTEGSVVG